MNLKLRNIFENIGYYLTMFGLGCASVGIILLAAFYIILPIVLVIVAIIIAFRILEKL